MMKPEGTQAYGEAGAGDEFNFKEFIRKPQVIIRIVSMLCSLIVFSCILSQGWEKDKCNFNGSSSTCGYGTFVSVMAFILSGIFIGVDYVFTTISNIIRRKYIVIADIILSGLWCFFYFSSFCNLCVTFGKTTNTFWEHRSGEDACRAVIAFSFFSVACFAGLTYLAIVRYRQGVSDLTSPYTGPNSDSYEQGFTP